MTHRDRYPAGVPCWVDLVQEDFEATAAFYRGLFGWTIEVRTPPGAPATYAYARLGDGTVAGLGSPPESGSATGWCAYVAVESADAGAAAVEAKGGTVIDPPTAVGPSGRVVQCADPEGARFGLWEPGTLVGAQVVNAPGSWNFSELNSRDLPGALAFYRAVFGWELGSFDPSGSEPGGFFRLAGYGAFLAELDPTLPEGGDHVPDGFADAVAVLQPLEGTSATPHWSTTFAVADAQESLARAERLGAEVVADLAETPYTLQATVRDPQGAVLTLSEYRPG